MFGIYIRWSLLFCPTRKRGGESHARTTLAGHTWDGEGGRQFPRTHCKACFFFFFLGVRGQLCFVESMVIPVGGHFWDQIFISLFLLQFGQILYSRSSHAHRTRTHAHSSGSRSLVYEKPHRYAVVVSSFPHTTQVSSGLPLIDCLSGDWQRRKLPTLRRVHNDMVCVLFTWFWIFSLLNISYPVWFCNSI